MVRVGDLAKGLLLKESREVDVVLMCLKAPTKSLLDKVVTLLKEKLKEIAPDKLYEVKLTWILVPASWTWSYRYVCTYHVEYYAFKCKSFAVTNTELKIQTYIFND
jgi:hypothetical protein